MMMASPPLFAPPMMPPAMPMPGPPAAPYYPPPGSQAAQPYPPQYAQQRPPAGPPPAPPMAALAYGSGGNPVPEVRNVPGGFPAEPRQPVYRGVMGSDEAPRAQAPALAARGLARSPDLVLPSPEHLGIGAARPEASAARSEAAVSLDWNGVHTRLNEMGALSSQVRRVADGGFRFTCLLPTGQADQAQRVEADGSTEVEAARIALARAEQYCRRGK